MLLEIFGKPDSNSVHKHMEIDLVPVIADFSCNSQPSLKEWSLIELIFYPGPI